MHDELNCVMRVPIFSRLAPQTLMSLRSISHHREAYVKGELIRQPLDSRNGLLIVDQGAAKVYLLSDDGQEKVLQIIKTGDIKGQENLFGKVSQPYFIEAVEETYVCSIDYQPFQTLLRQSPELCLAMLNHFGRQLLQFENERVQRDTLSAKARVWQYLQELHQQTDTASITLPMKKKNWQVY